MNHLTSSTSSLSSIYPTLSLSFFSELSLPLALSHAWLPPPSPLLSITLSLSLSLCLCFHSSAMCSHLTLIFSSPVSPHLSPFIISTTSPPSLQPSLSLSMQLVCRPFLSRSPTVGKQLIMGSRGDDPVGRVVVL